MKKEENYQIPEGGSLGLLAVGYRGIKAVRAAYPSDLFISSLTNDTIVIVSGLPRSGTSMMMKMLASANIPILTDELRKADENNLEGYFEFEPVKKLMADNTWMKDAKGKAVKIIAQLLPYINLSFKYKVIFMQRDIDEVLRSQEKMIGNVDPERSKKLKETFSRQKKDVLSFLDKNKVEYLEIDYLDCIQQVDHVVQKVSSFLACESHQEAMKQAINPNLYRNRKDGK